MNRVRERELVANQRVQATIEILAQKGVGNHEGIVLGRRDQRRLEADANLRLGQLRTLDQNDLSLGYASQARVGILLGLANGRLPLPTAECLDDQRPESSGLGTTDDHQHTIARNKMFLMK